MTGSMKAAIDETDRRRAKQTIFNTEHGITPKGVQKSVTDILESAHAPGGRGKRKAKQTLGEEFRAQIQAKSMTPAQLSKEIARLEQQMYTHAKNLEFEAAAATRDQVQKLKQHAFKE
jgi:excinuclease ABC subunit B